MPIISTTFDTPVGAMVAAATDEGICLLDFKFRRLLPSIQQRIARGLNDVFTAGTHPLLTQLDAELAEYFSGDRQLFSVPILPVGSEFQRAVWASLQRIDYGHTVTYMHQARVYGDEKAIRAVASANGMNGIAIIIPCHRVVGADGSLTGYAGGLPAKRWLLDHERKHAGRDTQATLF